MPLLGLQGNEYYVRCPNCGDSSNPNHGHLGINVKSYRYGCLKCGYGGKVTLEWLDKQNLSTELFNLESPTESGGFSIEKVYPFQYSDRPTAIPMDSVFAHGLYWDRSKIYTQKGQHLGYHYRSSNPKRSHTDIGRFKGISYSYAPEPLISFSDKPIRLVEGVYDATEDNDVVVYGILNPNVINLVKGHTIILRPDGDVWKKPDLQAITYKTIIRFMNSKEVNFLGIEVIKDGLDFDECNPEIDVEFVSSSELKGILND